jgi:hypothetical protein
MARKQEVTSYVNTSSVEKAYKTSNRGRMAVVEKASLKIYGKAAQIAMIIFLPFF